MLLVLTVVVAAPFTVVLWFAERAQRAKAMRIERQVAVTDAIHRELGAVVAPVVRRRFGGSWEIEVAVPFERPAVYGAVVGIAHRTLADWGEPPARFRIVLRAQERLHAFRGRLIPVTENGLSAQK